VAARHPGSGLIICDGVHFDGDRIISDRLLYGPTSDRLRTEPEGEITVQNFYRELLLHNGVYCCPAQTLIPRHVIEATGRATSARHSGDHHDYDVRIARNFPVTLHRDAHVRWRYLHTSLSGPADRRRFVWQFGAIAVLRDETRRCKKEELAFVQKLLHDSVCDISEEVYVYGRRYDPAFAKSYLLRLGAAQPRGAQAAHHPARALPARGGRGSRGRAPACAAARLTRTTRARNRCNPAARRC
jgi:hypothetical protein